MSNETAKTVDRSHLEAAVQIAEDRLEKLRAKYGKKLKVYLVLCKGVEQMPVTSDPLSILTTSPGMVAENTAKQKADRLLAQRKRIEKQGSKQAALDQLTEHLKAQTEHLKFISDAQIELRFTALHYEFVRGLKQDSLIDQQLTSPHGASIRIVMGSIGNLCRK